MTKQLRWVVRGYEAKRGKWLWSVLHFRSYGWQWQQVDRKTLEVIAEGRCKRKSDALCRCQKRAGRKLAWKETAWVFHGNHFSAWIERKRALVDDRWRWVWDYWVDICVTDGDGGFWEKRYSVQAWGKARSEREAKSLVEQFLQGTAVVRWSANGRNFREGRQ